MNRKKQSGGIMASRMIQNQLNNDTEQTGNNKGSAEGQKVKTENTQEQDAFKEQTADSSSWTEDDIEKDYFDQKQKKMSVEHKEGVWTKIMRAVLVAGCAYLVFLIFGVFITDYVYDGSGQVSAQRMSVEDIKAKQAFDQILTQYQYCRSLYESTLMLDYRLGAGVEDPLVIAPEYEGLLDTVEDLSVKTDALDVDSQYEQIKNMMLSWIQNDIAVYLQNMAAAISEDNVDTANNALQDYDRVYENFSLVTQNVVAMGEAIPGVDLSDVKTWTPESYIDEEINGA